MFVVISGRAKQQKTKASNAIQRAKRPGTSKDIQGMTQMTLRRDIAQRTNELSRVQAEAAKFDHGDLKEIACTWGECSFQEVLSHAPALQIFVRGIGCSESWVCR